MVACRSCGRNITSGTIRCSRCSSPYHLSCSHRYQISPEGIFNVCCGNQNVFNNSGPQPLLRNTRNNKRRQQQQQKKQLGVNEDDGSMRYGKLQKVQLIMGATKEPVADESTSEVRFVLCVMEKVEKNKKVKCFSGHLHLFYTTCVDTLLVLKLIFVLIEVYDTGKIIC